jgi:hypothetical protein
LCYIVLFVVSWSIFYLCIDFKRLPELYPYGLLSSFLGIWTDLIMVSYNLWSYSAPPFSKLTVPLLLDMSIYPVVAMLYIQHFPHGARLLRKMLYILFWVVPAICLESFFLARGEMSHNSWWTLAHSFFADWMIFGILIGTYRLLSPSAEPGRASS